MAEYVWSFFLLALNLIDYHYNINPILFLAISAAIISLLFISVIKKTESFPLTILIMLCHTWQISWINIFGNPTDTLQLPWFYIIGAIFIIYALINLNEIRSRQNNAAMLLCFIIMLVVSVFPVLNSASKLEGIKEFIMIIFFLLLVFAAFLLSDTVPSEKRKHLNNAYIWCIFITSVFLIIQTAAYHIFNITVFKYTVGMYMGYTQTCAHLLMEDTSASTIALGAAVFYILEKIESGKWKLYIPVLVTVVSAMAMTTRRTSVISLIIILAAYVIFHYKGIIKKSFVILPFLALVLIMIGYLTIVRPVDDLSQYLYENERFANYIRAIELSLKAPFGIGYDNNYLASLMEGQVIPHNTLLRWLAMGGFWFILPMIIILAYITASSFKKNLKAEYWILIYSLFASNFIPDILNARYLVIFAMAALLLCTNKDKCLNQKRGVPQ